MVSFRLKMVLSQEDGMGSSPTNDLKRSESSGWYESWSRDRGRCLSTIRAILNADGPRYRLSIVVLIGSIINEDEKQGKMD